MVMLVMVIMLSNGLLLATVKYWVKQRDYISDDQYAKYITKEEIVAGVVITISLVAIFTALVVLLGELSALPNLKEA
jgi:predicted histidine transporter YuiF (NhaC family)